MAEEEGVDRKLSIDKEVVSPRSRAVSMAGLETDVHVVPVEVLEQRFGTSVDGGHDVAEAVKRLEKEGKNVLEPPRDLPLAIKFILYLFEGFGLLLWAGAILCFIAWYPLSYNQPGGIYNLALSLCLVFVIVLSGLFNFLQVRASCCQWRPHEWSPLSTHPPHTRLSPPRFPPIGATQFASHGKVQEAPACAGQGAQGRELAQRGCVGEFTVTRPSARLLNNKTG
jgi:hypothetical protein